MSTTQAPKRLTFPVAFADIPVLVWCDLPHADALRILGEPSLTEWDEGLGMADFWGFEYLCGLKVAIEFSHQGNGGTVVADSPEVAHVLRHLPFERSHCFPIEEDHIERSLKLLLQAFPDRRTELESLRSIQVWRQDDLGTVFKVDEPTSERDALCRVKQLESLGHKQLYWYSCVT